MKDQRSHYELDLDIGAGGVSVPKKGGFFFFNPETESGQDKLVKEATEFVDDITKNQKYEYGYSMWRYVVVSVDDEPWANKIGKEQIGEIGRFFRLMLGTTADVTWVTHTRRKGVIIDGGYAVWINRQTSRLEIHDYWYDLMTNSRYKDDYNNWTKAEDKDGDAVWKKKYLTT